MFYVEQIRIDCAGMISSFKNMLASVLDNPASERIGRLSHQEIPHRTKAQVRTLYLVEGHNPKTIEGLGVGLNAKQISSLAVREGWSQMRQRAALAITDATNARADAAVKAVAEAIAIESEELCFGALKQTRAGLDKGGLDGAKQAQAASSTLRNLAGVAKMLREPGSSIDSDKPNVNLNIFFGAGSASARSEPQQVTEVVATDSK